MSPTVVALLIIIGAIAFAIYGFDAGIIRQLGSVAACIIGFVGGRLFAPRLAMILGIDEFICAAIIFLLLFTTTMMLVKVLRVTISMILLGPIDKMLGAIMGVLKWLVLTSLLLNLLIAENPSAAPALSAAPTQWTIGFLPRIFGMF